MKGETVAKIRGNQLIVFDGSAHICVFVQSKYIYRYLLFSRGSEAAV